MNNVLIVTALACFLIINRIGTQQCQLNVDLANKLSEPLSKFTAQLYQAISQTQPEKNTVFSPVSIAFGLSLLEAGASGETRAQINSVLIKPGSSDSDTVEVYSSLLYSLKQQTEKVTLNVVNGLYYKQGLAIKDSYLNTAKDCFKAQIEECSFNADPTGCANRINAWVANNTGQKITQLFSDNAISPSTVAVLANAVYFKAGWKKGPFRFDSAGSLKFYRFGRDQDQQSVKYFYSQMGERFPFTESSKAKVVGVPYEGNRYLLCIVLPKEQNGLGQMNGEKLVESCTNVVNADETPVHIKMPRFKVKTNANLKSILTSMGLNNMFKSGAQFDRMATGPLIVNEAVHEAFMDVHENGTEAAAATGIGMIPVSMPPPPIPFTVDHPFFYGIVHVPTRTLVFAGKVVTIEQ